MGDDQELTHQIPHPALKTNRERSTHTHGKIDTSSRKTHTVNRMSSSFPNIGMSLSYPNKKISTSIYLIYFIFNLHNKTKQKADWVAKQVTKPPKNISKRT